MRRRLGEWIAASSANARAWTSAQDLSRLARGMTPELSAEWRPALDAGRRDGIAARRAAAIGDGAGGSALPPWRWRPASPSSSVPAC